MVVAILIFGCHKTNLIEITREAQPSGGIEGDINGGEVGKIDGDGIDIIDHASDANIAFFAVGQIDGDGVANIFSQGRRRAAFDQGLAQGRHSFAA